MQLTRSLQASLAEIAVVFDLLLEQVADGDGEDAGGRVGGDEVLGRVGEAKKTLKWRAPFRH